MARNDLDEEDWSDDADATDAESVPCPECGAEIYPDLDCCPRCGYWLTDANRRTHETGLFASRRVRLIAAVLLVIFVLSLLAELFLL